MPTLLATLLLVCLSLGPVCAQRSYLDGGLEPTSKGKAAFYLEPGAGDASGWSAQIFTMAGVLKAKGHYADAECKVPDGRFVFFFPDGKVESEGNYANGYKQGIWARNDKWGRELAEKVYDLAPLENLVYTIAETMPQYPGGEKAMVRYVREKVGKSRGDVMASFIVEKDGHLSDVQVVGANDPRIADQIASAISGAPHWEAGKQDGQPVRVQMRVPLK